MSHGGPQQTGYGGGDVANLPGFDEDGIDVDVLYSYFANEMFNETTDVVPQVHHVPQVHPDPASSPGPATAVAAAPTSDPSAAAAVGVDGRRHSLDSGGGGWCRDVRVEPATPPVAGDPASRPPEIDPRAMALPATAAVAPPAAAAQAAPVAAASTHSGPDAAAGGDDAAQVAPPAAAGGGGDAAQVAGGGAGWEDHDAEVQARWDRLMKAAQDWAQGRDVKLDVNLGGRSFPAVSIPAAPPIPTTVTIPTAFNRDPCLAGVHPVSLSHSDDESIGSISAITAPDPAPARATTEIKKPPIASGKSPAPAATNNNGELATARATITKPAAPITSSRPLTRAVTDNGGENVMDTSRAMPNSMTMGRSNVFSYDAHLTDDQRIKTMSPQQYLDDLLSSRGYSTKTYSSLECGYHTRPTPLQLASYGTAVLRAVQTNDAPTFTSLLRSGLSRNPCNAFSFGVMSVIIKHGHTGLFRAQMDAGATVHVADDYGRTPLHHAAWAKKADFDTVVTTILDVDVRMLRIEDRRGLTPLRYVQENQYGAWIQFLESKKDVYWPERPERWWKEAEVVPRVRDDGDVVPDPPDALPHEQALRMSATGDTAGEVQVQQEALGKKRQSISPPVVNEVLAKKLRFRH